ncbi:unnamed protein product [Chironomus riparius]|uniref:Hemolymph juvenile hormone binding protein n=1 Tax=Chironomus riparius TaxID=315576 RepID=A0A9N9S632_9DIPT|nr:unnamed protein product [Chironomus riparius]
MKLFVILTILYLIIGAFAGLPPTVPRCRRDHPNMSQCIVNAIEVLQPRFASGDLGGGWIVPKLEPFHIKELSYGDDGGLKVHLRGLNIYGTSKFKIDKLRANAQELKFDALVGLPTFEIHAKYRMEFNFLGARLKSNGDYFAEHTGAKLIMPLRGRRFVQNGIEKIRFDPIAIKFDRGTVTKLRISNLFGGNKALEEIVHSLIISNPDFVYKSVYPQLESELSKVFTDIANKIVETTTFDEMFPLQ